jgi:hypothetical protein
MTKRGAVAYAALLLAFFGYVGFSEFRHHRLQKQLDTVTWDLRLNEHIQEDRFISPTIGSIQFFKNGRYSVEIEELKYTGNGLELSGYVGNGTQLNLTTLTVTFEAERPYYKNRDRYLQERTTSGTEWYTVGWPDDDIGKGQVLLSFLGAGSRVPFAVTIPNVKQQNSDQPEIAVSFSGERYSYSR